MKNKEVSRRDEAIGLFWGVSFFAGALTAVIIGFHGNMRSDWLFAGLVGFCVFIICGLAIQGVITLLGGKRDEKEPE